MRKNLVVFIAFLIVASLYCYYRSTSIGFGDSLGLMLNAEKGFNPATQANGHFLYQNLLHLFILILPFGTMFFKASLFSIIFSVLTMLMVYKSVKMLTGNYMTGLISATVFALSFVNWRQTEIIEVYTLNNFLFALMLYYVLKDISGGGNRHQKQAAIVFGLAFLAHIQNILLIPFYLLYLWLINKGQLKKCTIPLIITIAIASPLILIPLIFDTNSILSVFFQNNDIGSLVTSLVLKTFITGFIKSIGYFIYNFLLYGFFVIYGLRVVYQKNKSLFWLLLTGILPFWLFAMKFDVPDNYVFFLQANMLCIILGGYSLSFWLEKVPHYSLLFLVAVFLSFPSIYYFTYTSAEKIPVFKKVEERKAYKGGLKYLLWPGMRNNADLIELSRKIYLSGKKPDSFSEFEWNYVQAVEYLQKKGELK